MTQTESLSPSHAYAFDPSAYRFEITRTAKAVRIDTYRNGQRVEYSIYRKGFDAEAHVAREIDAIAWLAS